MSYFSKIAKTLALTAGVALLPAAAQAESASAPETGKFSHEGVNYTYSAKTIGKRTIITGKAGHKDFRLVVFGTKISGRYNQNPVQFSLNDVKITAEAMAMR